MALHLITGYAGTEHITSADQGAYNAATFGSGEFVLDRGQKFAQTVLSNNSIRIADGEAMMQGRYIKMASGTNEDLTITNGTQGKKRNDLICIRYEKSAADSTESASFVVIKGNEADSNPTDPEYTHGNITDGTDTVNEMPLYRVTLDGINIDSVTALFTTKVSMVEYMDNYQLKPAKTNELGGIMVGEGLAIDDKGELKTKINSVESAYFRIENGRLGLNWYEGFYAEKDWKGRTYYKLRDRDFIGTFVCVSDDSIIAPNSVKEMEFVIPERYASVEEYAVQIFGHFYSYANPHLIVTYVGSNTSRGEYNIVNKSNYKLRMIIYNCSNNTYNVKNHEFNGHMYGYIISKE